MAALPAELLFADERADGRGAQRREFRCFVEAQGENGELRATIENISRTGMLIETKVPLRDGEAISIELPNSGPVEAQVVWTYGTLAGCEFHKPLSQGAVSAALLFSSHLLPPRAAEPFEATGPDARVERAERTSAAATRAGWLVLGLTVAMLLVALVPLVLT